MIKRQQGLTSVEFALIGLLAMIVMFGVIEIGRLAFVFNALEEATRRGARVAAVCQVNDPGIAEVAIFNPSGGGANSALVAGLTTADVVVEYLNQAGATIGDPIGNFALIRFVRVSINAFNHQLLIPLMGGALTLPNSVSTLPRESLGVWPGGFSPC